MAEIYNTNLLNVAISYIKLLKIPVTTSSLKMQLQENPYFPSLYSISHVFDRFQISHQAFKIDKENFEKLQPPFIAYLKGQNTGKDFVLVTSITGNEVGYIAENKKPKRAEKEDFLKSWQNIQKLTSNKQNYSIPHFLSIVRICLLYKAEDLKHIRFFKNIFLREKCRR